MLNEYFDKHRETRRRNIFINTASVISFSPSLRLLSSNELFSSMGKVCSFVVGMAIREIFNIIHQVYEQHCISSKIDPHCLSELFIQADSPSVSVELK